MTDRLEAPFSFLPKFSNGIPGLIHEPSLMRNVLNHVAKGEELSDFDLSKKLKYRLMGAYSLLTKLSAVSVSEYANCVCKLRTTYRSEIAGDS